MMNHTNRLGVIGGLGPLATARFLELVTLMTDAQRDQDHIDMILHSDPTIPDRTRYIMDHSNPSPVPQMIAVGKELMRLGADHLAIPCVTAHAFYDLLQRELSVPIINAVQETIQVLADRGIRSAGIMATHGTNHSRLFQNALNDVGIVPITPIAHYQTGVMSLIYDDIKAGKRGRLSLFNTIAESMRDDGAEVIILGCTELSLFKRDCLLGPGYIDAMEVLAHQSILACGKTVKEHYRNLIT